MAQGCFIHLLALTITLQCFDVRIVDGLSGHGSYVMNLDHRFEEIRGNDPYLVEFYAPWCGHCKKLEPIYEKVGAKLDGTGIFVAKVDATLNTDMAAKFDVHGFPTILYVQGKKVVNYRGDRTSEDIAIFAIRCRSPAIQPMYSVGGLRDRLRKNSEDAFFVYVGEENHHLFTDYRGVAENHSVIVDFYRADAKAMKQEIDENAKLPLVLVYKDGRRYEFLPLEDSNLAYWVDEERYTAVQPAKGAAFHDLMGMDKMLVLLVAKQNSDDQEIKQNSKRAVVNARPIAMDRNLKRFQFVLMDSGSTVSNIVLGPITVPYAIAFHPITHLFYTTETPVEDMNSQDWIDFLTGITTDRLKAQGGKGFFRQMHRALYGLVTSILELWTESRFLFGVVVVIPMVVISLVIYTLCCVSWGEEDGEQEEVDDDEEAESDEEPQVDKKTGHFKTE